MYVCITYIYIYVVAITVYIYIFFMLTGQFWVKIKKSQGTTYMFYCM